MTTVRRRVARTGSGDLSDASPVRSPNAVGAPESDYDSARSESDLSEHGENGDAQRPIDHDEDRSNPQYIPKRGTFYEHDDRTAASGEEAGAAGEPPPAEGPRGEDAPPERRARPPRKSDACDRWSHDKYIDNDQAPKSRDELIAAYGYDIRNEDAPPHARRNRRYGRGPNKYTRTWEDEEAYRRQAQAQARKPQAPPTPQDFPELEESGRRQGKPRERPRSPRRAVPDGGSPPRAVRAPDRRNGAARPRPVAPPAANAVPAPNAVNVNSSSSPPQRKLNASAHGQQRPVLSAKESPQNRSFEVVSPREHADRERHTPPQKPPTQQPAQPASKPPPPQPQATPPPATIGENRAGSKRYSSLRQRPLAEGYTPSATPPAGQPQPLPQTLQQPLQPQPLQQALQQHRYAQEFQPGQQPHQGSPGPQMHPQPMMHQVHRNAQVAPQPHGPSPPHQALPQSQHQALPQPQHQALPQPQHQSLPQQQHQALPQPQHQTLPQPQHQALPQPQHQTLPQPQHQALPQPQHPQQVRLGILEQQQLVSHPHQHTMHNISQPHTMAAQMPPAQGYATPAMMPAQYMQGASSAVYASPPVYAPPPPAPYPHQLYQHHNYTHPSGGGGVTYYSAAEQEPPPAPRAPRRPTAAIPIVPPPPPHHVKSGSNSSEKDSIDRIVDNMFVRKQRPAAHAPAPEKGDSSPSTSLTSSISTDSRPSAERDPNLPDPADPKPEDHPDPETISFPEPEVTSEVQEATKAVEELSVRELTPETTEP